MSPDDVAAAKARARKERLAAKMKAGGASRLDKITGLGGGVKRGRFVHFSVSLIYFFYLFLSLVLRHSEQLALRTLN